MPPSTYHHADLRAELVAATAGIVERDGAGAVTIARVAQQCGVSVAAPYRHFAGKSALLGAVAAQGFAQLGGALAAAARQQSAPADRLVEAGVAYVGFATEHPHLFTLMFDAPERDSSPEAPQALAGLGALVAALNLTVPADVALRATWAIAHGEAALRVGGMRTFTDDDSVDRLRTDLRALLGGILQS